eukprot:4822799-Prymnesium_polylepis.1
MVAQRAFGGAKACVGEQRAWRVAAQGCCEAKGVAEQRACGGALETVVKVRGGGVARGQAAWRGAREALPRRKRKGRWRTQEREAHH